jgi:hypothetical protein
VKDVPYITVADSRIYPDSGHVTIEAEAKMRTLNRARIVTDSLMEFHEFKNVSANIFGKKSFKASGDYVYVNKGGKPQTVSFQDIGVYKAADKNLKTYARTKIDTARHFEIIPNIGYKGNMEVLSDTEGVHFNGFAHLNIQNPKVRTDWFSVNNTITRDSAYVYYKNPENEGRQPVASGIVLEADSANLYASFFSKKRSGKDKNIFLAEGIVFYDEEAKEFVAGDPRKIAEGSLKGNVLRYNDATGKARAEGAIDLGLNFGLVEVKAAGSIQSDLTKNSNVFNMNIGIRFSMEKELLDHIAKQVNDGNYDAYDADYATEAFLKAMPEFFTDEKTEKAFNQKLNTAGSFVKSNELPFTIFLTEVEMKWDRVTKAFYNTQPFTVAFIDEKNVAKKIVGYLEFGYKRSGDFMNLYLPSGDDYYFFSYTNGNMQVATSDNVFNQALIGINPEKRREEKDGKVYQYNPGSEQKKTTFVNRMKYFQEGGAQ